MAGHGAEGDLDARVGWIERLEEVNLENPIIVDAERLAHRVLRDLQPTVHVAAERRGEVKADREGQKVRPQGFQQHVAVRGASERDHHLPGDQQFVPTSHSREHSSAIDRRVLMIDAGWHGQSNRETVG